MTDRLTRADWTPSLLREQLATGWEITLPSEAEWEKAARGRDGRTYPWGDEIDASKTNSLSNSGIGATTSPVGMFPDGASPYNALDMSGNVWEWTRSQWGEEEEPSYRYPYDADDAERENVKDPGAIRRVVRGGSFFDDVLLQRASARLGYLPQFRYFDQGFRWVYSRVRP